MRSLTMPKWPGGAEVAVCLTFDVDAEPGLLCHGAQFSRRLTSLSEARYGVVRGIPRIIELLAEHGVVATFYVPGLTAEMHPDAIRAIVDAGHEIAHHGYAHAKSEGLKEDEQREELEKGIAAIRQVTGTVPAGYRSPAWEVTPETFRMLDELGFEYDSSFMADDRPYIEEHDGREIVELPVHWSLDDWPYFGWSPYSGGVLGDAEVWRRTCRVECEVARRDRGAVTYTMHPEIIGRGHRFDALAGLVGDIHASGTAWFATHRQLARAVAPAVTR